MGYSEVGNGITIVYSDDVVTITITNVPPNFEAEVPTDVVAALKVLAQALRYN